MHVHDCGCDLVYHVQVGSLRLGLGTESIILENVNKVRCACGVVMYMCCAHAVHM